MKTKLLTGLALAASLLIGAPAFAKDHKDGKGKDKNKEDHHSAKVEHARGNVHTVAVRQPESRAHYSNGNGHYSNSNVAYRRDGNNNHGSYAFASHSGWNRGQEYNWNGHHYRWYDNAWFIIGPSYETSSPVVYQSAAPRNSVSTSVQAALARQGYYRGPIDGLVGPGTRSAIAAYQQDNGLSVTGSITSGLVNNLGI